MWNHLAGGVEGRKMQNGAQKILRKCVEPETNLSHMYTVQADTPFLRILRILLEVSDFETSYYQAFAWMS